MKRGNKPYSVTFESLVMRIVKQLSTADHRVVYRGPGFLLRLLAVRVQAAPHAPTSTAALSRCLKKQPCRCRHRRPTTTTTYPPSDDDDDSHDDDIDLDDDEVAEILAKEARRRAVQRAASARYRARHPERVAAEKRHYRARYPEKVAAERWRYWQKYQAKYLEAQRRYYYTHVEQSRDYERQRRQSEHRRAWRAQHRAKMREAALARKTEQAKSYPARYRERWRTGGENKSLGVPETDNRVGGLLETGEHPCGNLFAHILSIPRGG